MLQKILENLFRFEDTCHVYVIRSGMQAALIDFGSGAVLDHLSEMGITQVTDVLMTHHHRDQGQGLPRAAASGIRIWVPQMEQDLFAQVDAHWQARELYNNYNSRQDRFSLLTSVPIAGVLGDYEMRPLLGGDRGILIVPTPGHTTGSITIISAIDGVKVAFTGDLISAPGQVWSMAATQWTYNGAEGVAAGIASLLELKDHAPQILLPSHGETMRDPVAAIDQLVDRFWQLLQLRGQNLRLLELREHPYEAITPHLLRHRASLSNCYVLVSESKKALFFDFGYDFVTGFINGFDRAARRPSLYTIPRLKEEFGIERIDVVIPTHFHDDHVAGINLLRKGEGTQHWAADFFSDILEHPESYDLPCLWYDPIPVDRRLPLETAFRWEEYSLTLYPLPGHTRYAVAIAVEVDGQRILVTGDQYQGSDGLEFNYVYPNRFAFDDYVKSAQLYTELNPTIILTGHWDPLVVPAGYFDKITAMGNDLERLHRELLGTAHIGEESVFARIEPYQVTVQVREPFSVMVELHNPSSKAMSMTVQMVVPSDWRVMNAAGDSVALTLDAQAFSTVTFRIQPSATPMRRARIAADVTIDGQRRGQLVEALVTTR